eukprot:1902225-Rhodomonas_salina.1
MASQLDYFAAGDCGVVHGVCDRNIWGLGLDQQQRGGQHARAKPVIIDGAGDGYGGAGHDHRLCGGGDDVGSRQHDYYAGGHFARMDDHGLDDRGG